MGALELLLWEPTVGFRTSPECCYHQKSSELKTLLRGRLASHVFNKEQCVKIIILGPIHYRVRDREQVCVTSSWECRITVLMPLVASLVSTHLVRIPNLLYGMIHRTTLLKAKFHTYRILYPNHICLLTVSSLWTCLKTGPINVSGFYLRQSDNLRWASFTSAKSFCLYQESILLSDTCRYGEGTHHPKLLVCRYPSIARDQCRRVQKP